MGGGGREEDAECVEGSWGRDIPLPVSKHSSRQPTIAGEAANTKAIASARSRHRHSDGSGSGATVREGFAGHSANYELV